MKTILVSHNELVKNPEVEIACLYKSLLNAGVPGIKIEGTKNIVKKQLWRSRINNIYLPSNSLKNIWEHLSLLYDENKGEVVSANQFKPLLGYLHNTKCKRNDPCPCNSGLKYKKCCTVVH